MRALLSLDAITANDTTRPLRRNQVIEVQQLLDEMDQITNKLRSISSTLSKDPAVIEKRKRESEASLAAHQDPVPALRRSQEAAEEEKKKKEAEQQKDEMGEQQPKEQQKPQEEDEEEEEKEEEEDEEKEEEEEEEDEETKLLKEMIPLWKGLKLRPRFEEQEQREAYVLTSMIPGLNRDEIVINQDQDPEDGSDMIVVSGARVPSLEELKKMIHQINQLQAAKRINITTQRGLQLALLQLGKGRYGSFEERFSLPDDAIANKVYATYNGGRLGIVIPRHPRQYRQYTPRYASPLDGLYGGRGRYGGFPGFF